MQQEQRNSRSSPRSLVPYYRAEERVKAIIDLGIYERILTLYFFDYKRLGRYFTAKGKVNDGPWFVVGKDVDKNELYISNDIACIKAPVRTFGVDILIWVNSSYMASAATNSHHHLSLKMRHGPELLPCTLTIKDRLTATGSDATDHTSRQQHANRAEVVLENVEKGIAPGQFVAFYKLDVCIGTGVIIESDSSLIS